MLYCPFLIMSEIISTGLFFVIYMKLFLHIEIYCFVSMIDLYFNCQMCCLKM